jgi:hypothetical protein
VYGDVMVPVPTHAEDIMVRFEAGDGATRRGKARVAFFRWAVGKGKREKKSKGKSQISRVFGPP